MTPPTGIDSGWHPSVDAIAIAYFNFQLQLRFFEARGTAFQKLFVDIMQAAFGEEFWATGTYGNVGDMKCDGYLKPQRRIFALYAPNDFLRKSWTAKTKISNDHSGAIAHWKAHMAVWTLVHNGRDGLPAPIQDQLLALQEQEPETPVSQWGLNEIRAIVKTLTFPQLVALFGPAPTKKEFAHAATQGDLAQVIADMAAVVEYAGIPQDSESSTDLRAVPPRKLEFNNLSQAVRQWLSVGRPHAAKVIRFFERHTDPTLAERVVQAFQRKYTELRLIKGLTPDEVFSELNTYAGGDHPDPKVKLTAIAVVAYLFEACHIFERPPDSHDAASN